MNRRYFVALLACCATAGGAARLAAQSPKEIRVSAKKFEFHPNKVTVKQGQPVTFVLTTEDRIHGFKIVDFGVRVDVVPGQETRVTMTPDKAGSFNFFCDIFCGDGHDDMDGTLVVEG